MEPYCWAMVFQLGHERRPLLLVADRREQHGAAADAEDHDDLLDAREPLDAEHHEQEGDDVGHRGDDEAAPRVAEAAEELLGGRVVEPVQPMNWDIITMPGSAVQGAST